ncbi:hypothetical protein SDC9_201127 [bioreactor metagenome]|uniref:Uncharacterized protein n=1 Tax=bioreactor metagenome TaxID=1076179 RepID=A0A645J1Y9_9ZZZZ
MIVIVSVAGFVVRSGSVSLLKTFSAAVVSSFIMIFKSLLATGASLTAVTVTLKLAVLKVSYLPSSSLTVSVIVEVPFQRPAGVIVTLRSPLPKFATTILLSGIKTRFVLETVTVKPDQSSSTSETVKDSGLNAVASGPV